MSRLAPPLAPARSPACRFLAFKPTRHPSSTVHLPIPLGPAREYGQIGQIAPSQVAFVYDPSDHWQQYGRNHKVPRVHGQQQGRNHRVPRILAAKHPNGREHHHEHEIKRHRPPDIPSADRSFAVAWWWVSGQLNLRSRDEDYGHANPADHVFGATVGFDPKHNSCTDGRTAPSATPPDFASTHCTPPFPVSHDTLTRSGRNCWSKAEMSGSGNAVGSVRQRMRWTSERDEDQVLDQQHA